MTAPSHFLHGVNSSELLWEVCLNNINCCNMKKVGVQYDVRAYIIFFKRVGAV